MQSEIIRARSDSAMRMLVSAVALLASGTAFADDPNPYYLGVSAGVSHDSNIFRLPSSSPTLPTNVQGDTYYSAGLVAGIDQPFGRQHFTASGNVKYNRFSHLTDLNNTSFGLNTELDWEALDRLSGTLSAAVNQNLASYSTTAAQLLTIKNVETDGQFLARAQYGLVSLLSLDGQIAHQQVRYSADAYAIYETTQDSARIGLRYRPSGQLTLGAYVQTAHGRYPGVRVQGSEETYNRNDIILTGSWIATGQSSFQGRISAGRQSYDHSSQSDFSGATGQLIWNYTPTGKLKFVTTASRETGFESGFLSLSQNGPGAPTNDTSRLTSSLSVAATYAATAKIALNASVRYAHRSLSNSILAAQGGPIALAQGTDTIQDQSLGITYTPLRSLQFNCTVGHDSRSVSDGLPVSLSYPYSANTAGCSAQLTLQ